MRFLVLGLVGSRLMVSCIVLLLLGRVVVSLWVRIRVWVWLLVLRVRCVLV